MVTPKNKRQTFFCLNTVITAHLDRGAERSRLRDENGAVHNSQGLVAHRVLKNKNKNHSHGISDTN